MKNSDMSLSDASIPSWQKLKIQETRGDGNGGMDGRNILRRDEHI